MSTKLGVTVWRHKGLMNQGLLGDKISANIKAKIMLYTMYFMNGNLLQVPVAKWKTAVSLLLIYWGYQSLALSHQCNYENFTGMLMT